MFWQVAAPEESEAPEEDTTPAVVEAEFVDAAPVEAVARPEPALAEAAVQAVRPRGGHATVCLQPFGKVLAERAAGWSVQEVSLQEKLVAMKAAKKSQGEDLVVDATTAEAGPGGLQGALNGALEEVKLIDWPSLPSVRTSQIMFLQCARYASYASSFFSWIWMETARCAQVLGSTAAVLAVVAVSTLLLLSVNLALSQLSGKLFG